MAAQRDQAKSQFVLVVYGQVESAYFPCVPDLWVGLSYSLGPDWNLVSGLHDALSSCCTLSSSDRFVFNLPFEATFSSTNPFKWPQMVFSCYGRDSLGNDVIRGYGAMPLPTTPGSHKRSVPCFAPEPSSLFQRLVGSLWGRRPELADPTVVARAEGRQVTRVTTNGILHISIHVVLKDLKKFGFDVLPGSLKKQSELPLPHFGTRTAGPTTASAFILSTSQTSTANQARILSRPTSDSKLPSVTETSQDEQSSISVPRPLPALVDDNEDNK